MRPRNNINQFKIGTIFLGLVNKHKLEIISIEQTPMCSANGRCWLTNKKAVIKDHTTGHIFKTSYANLAYCQLQIVS